MRASISSGLNSPPAGLEEKGEVRRWGERGEEGRGGSGGGAPPSMAGPPPVKSRAAISLEARGMPAAVAPVVAIFPAVAAAPAAPPAGTAAAAPGSIEPMAAGIAEIVEPMAAGIDPSAATTGAIFLPPSSFFITLLTQTPTLFS